jgi:hypothetical protein
MLRPAARTSEPNPGYHRPATVLQVRFWRQNHTWGTCAGGAPHHVNNPALLTGIRRVNIMAIMRRYSA